MENGKQYVISVKNPIGAPPEYAARNLEFARRKAGNELYNILYTSRLPAVVDIEEVSIHHPANSLPEYRFFAENELQIVMTVTPVVHRHVEIAYMPSLPVSRYIAKYPPKNKIKHALQRLAYYIAKVADS